VIPNITRGASTLGVLTYLAGPGRHNEHRRPRLIAGDTALMEWTGHGPLDRETTRQVAGALDRPRRLHGTRVVRTARAEDGGTGERRDAHVWHCSLSLSAREAGPSDERWRAITTEFVERMGFAGEAPCRWAAIAHGPSAAGNEHVHLVVNLVREDGSVASTWNDRPRAQAACGELERAYGLEVLESRAAGRGGLRGRTPAEDRRAGPAPTSRERLERIIRGSAGAAASEHEFIVRVRAQGVRLRPRYARDQAHVEGYAAALRGEGETWFSGGRLARDLTLPRLREHWSDGEPERRAAALAWAGRGGEAVGAPAEVDWEARAGELSDVRERLAAIPPEDQASWARIAHDAAGAFAAWALEEEPDGGPLTEAARQLARASQLHAHQRGTGPRDPAGIRGLGMLAASLARGGKGRVGQVALLRQLVRTAQAVHDAQRARGEARTAHELATVARERLAAIGQHLGAGAPAGPNSAPAPGPARPLGPSRPPGTRQPPGRDRGVER
jgi:hypothetical protein